MGKREGEQEDLFVTHQQLRSQSHPFYRAVNRVLADQGFDRHVEQLCSKFYAKKMGRPGLAPGIYFRSLLLGFFEGIDSERGIAWHQGRNADAGGSGASRQEAKEEGVERRLVQPTRTTPTRRSRR